MPLTMPPGALVYSVDPKKRYGGLLRPVPCRRHGVVRVEAEDPVQLIGRVPLQCRGEGMVAAEVPRGEPRRERERREACVLALPPRRRVRVVRIEEPRVARAGLRLHELTRVAERVRHLTGDGELPLQRRPDRGQHRRLRCLAGDLEIRQQADDGKARIGGVEERPVLVVRAPIVTRTGGKPLDERLRASIGRRTILRVAGRAEQLRRRHERAVVVDDVLVAVVGELGVVLGQVRPGVLRRLQIAGAQLARHFHRGRARQRGNRQSAAGAEARLVLAIVRCR